MRKQGGRGRKQEDSQVIRKEEEANDQHQQANKPQGPSEGRRGGFSGRKHGEGGMRTGRNHGDFRARQGLIGQQRAAPLLGDDSDRAGLHNLKAHAHIADLGGLRQAAKVKAAAIRSNLALASGVGLLFAQFVEGNVVVVGHEGGDLVDQLRAQHKGTQADLVGGKLEGREGHGGGVDVAAHLEVLRGDQLAAPALLVGGHHGGVGDAAFSRLRERCRRHLEPLVHLHDSAQADGPWWLHSEERVAQLLHSFFFLVLQFRFV